MERLCYLALRWNWKVLSGCQRLSSRPVSHLAEADSSLSNLLLMFQRRSQTCGGWTEAAETYMASVSLCWHGWRRCGVDDGDAPTICSRLQQKADCGGKRLSRSSWALSLLGLPTVTSSIFFDGKITFMGGTIAWIWALFPQIFTLM